MRRIEVLEEMKRMEENRLLVTSCEAVCASLRHHIAYLEQQVEDTRKQLKDHIQAHPTLREQQRLLCSIPGIAHATAALLLAELGSSELGSIEPFQNARQVAAFRGPCSLSARVGFQRARKTTSLQGWIAAPEKSPLFPRHHRAALQSGDCCLGRTSHSKGQMQNAHYRGGDAKTLGTGLWSPQSLGGLLMQILEDKFPQFSTKPLDEQYSIYPDTFVGVDGYSQPSKGRNAAIFDLFALVSFLPDDLFRKARDQAEEGARSHRPMLRQHESPVKRRVGVMSGLTHGALWELIPVIVVPSDY